MTKLLTLVMVTVFCGKDANWEKFALTDLGTLGGNTSRAYGINDLGQVVGWAKTPDGLQHAFLWSNGQMVNLGGLGGNNSLDTARGINANGQVVGYSSTNNGRVHAFLWQNGVMEDLGTLGGTDSLAHGINDAGQIVGAAQIPGDGLFHPFLWENGVMRDFANTTGCAFAINERGQIVGSDNSTDRNRYFLYSDGRMYVQTEGKSYGLNDIDPVQVVGFLGLEGEGQSHIFIWQGESIENLGSGVVYGINDKGWVVGLVYNHRNKASLFAGGHRWSLKRLTYKDYHWTLAEATAVNNSGQIVGWGWNPDGEERAFLLTPVKN